jgi:hypothetical protein
MSAGLTGKDGRFSVILAAKTSIVMVVVKIGFFPKIFVRYDYDVRLWFIDAIYMTRSDYGQ